MLSKNNRWIVAALPLAMACSVSAQGTVTGVTTRQIDGGLAVFVAGKDLAKPTTRWDDGAVVLRFNAGLDGKGRMWKPNTGGINAISFGAAGKEVDVAVRPSKKKQPQIAEVEGGWLVYFEDEIGSIPALHAKKAATTPVKTQATKLNPAPVNPRDFKPRALVTLNFVNTDVVQIMKALAMQANVNVAMGPDVTGKVTINLENVPVEEAMELVTTLSGIRYAYVGNTYIVSSNARFGETMDKMAGRADKNSETRVIPLFSREGNQVKAAVLKVVPATTATGKYELVLPSEKVNVEQVQAITPVNPTDGKEGAQPTNGSAGVVHTKSTEDTAKKDDYVVLVGTPGRMDDVEKAVRNLDEQICMALGLKMGTSQAMVRKTYQPQGILAQDLVKALVGDSKTEFNGVQVLATPATSVAKQAIVLSGRQSDVDRVLAMIQDLDAAPDGQDTHYEVVNLRYVMPNMAWSQIMQEVPGLKVSMLPAPINPQIGIDYKESFQNNGAAGDSGSGDNGGSNGGTNGGTSASNGGSGGGEGGNGNTSGTTLGSNGTANASSVKTGSKSNSVPMKLLLRGTRGQIEAAKNYLAMVDIAPKQVAIELRVMELSREEALKVGLDWSLLTGGTLRALRVNQGLSDASLPGGVGGSGFFRGGGQLDVVGALDQLSTRNNVLARPSILANDGVPTNIFIGDEVRYIKSIVASQNGVTVITDQIDVGVDFSVIARVGDDGNIMLDLGPTLKVLQGFTPVPGGGNLPQTSRRSAQSQMLVKSGETLAIGGLIQDQDRKSYGGIPILKDLPIIGRLFGRTENRKVRSEVVFFVTVKEVDASTRASAANPRQAEKDNTQWPGNGNGKGRNGG